ncbi:MAG: hypothetical protein MPEBLZ_03570 [Candidatus Methanoperedens nitroreducens]|uniref:Uncharacterized protein n=1 Tax=Candidatus Methanoperedens nitratireducens TaxID=1392998 RepID=A0A0P8CGS0_9EURY|nr:MAG: hypothetical protein MPEBLZ_03570 [Candidatus Methanoperedens sp. BLZ1]
MVAEIYTNPMYILLTFEMLLNQYKIMYVQIVIEPQQFTFQKDLKLMIYIKPF